MGFNEVVEEYGCVFIVFRLSWPVEVLVYYFPVLLFLLLVSLCFLFLSLTIWYLDLEMVRGEFHHVDIIS